MVSARDTLRIMVEGTCYAVMEYVIYCANALKSIYVLSGSNTLTAV